MKKRPGCCVRPFPFPNYHLLSGSSLQTERSKAQNPFEAPDFSLAQSFLLSCPIVSFTFPIFLLIFPPGLICSHLPELILPAFFNCPYRRHYSHAADKSSIPSLEFKQIFGIMIVYMWREALHVSSPQALIGDLCRFGNDILFSEKIPVTKMASYLF